MTLLRPAVDADLGGLQGGPRQVVKRADAAGFVTVGTVGAGVWPERDGTTRPESSLLIRGTQGVARFAVIWRTVEGLASQPGAVCYWWSARQRVTIDGEDHEWTADRPHPVRVGYRDLLKILSDRELWERPWSTASARAGSRATAGGSVRTSRKVRTDGVS